MCNCRRIQFSATLYLEANDVCSQNVSEENRERPIATDRVLQGSGQAVHVPRHYVHDEQTTNEKHVQTQYINTPDFFTSNLTAGQVPDPQFRCLRQTNVHQWANVLAQSLGPRLRKSDTCHVPARNVEKHHIPHFIPAFPARQPIFNKSSSQAHFQDLGNVCLQHDFV